MAKSVEELEQAVSALSEEQLKAFRAWFEEFDAQTWDAQIERDVDDGKLDALAAAALDAYRRGDTREL